MSDPTERAPQPEPRQDELEAVARALRHGQPHDGSDCDYAVDEDARRAIAALEVVRRPEGTVALADVAAAVREMPLGYRPQDVEAELMARFAGSVFPESSRPAPTNDTH